MPEAVNDYRKKCSMIHVEQLYNKQDNVHMNTESV